MKYRESDIEKLIESIKIEDLIGEYVELKRSGSNFKGRCPFHHEKTASFMVSPVKKIFKCFGCDAGGDAIKFYQKVNNIDYYTAVSELGKKYRVEIKSVKGFEKEEDEHEKRYHEIMEKAHEFFTKNIFAADRSGIEYFEKRGMDRNFIEKYGLGYIPESWNKLTDYLLEEGYSEKELIEAALIKRSENGERLYDIFRGRVMFPIYSPYGKVIAFGGRVLADDNKEIAKYLNSPETPYFEKGKNIYGLFNKGEYIRKNGYVILMEGYMDVLTAHKHGITSAVASLGTAFTDEQAKLLKRYSSNIIISYDMDSAGKNACERASFILKRNGFNVRVVSYSYAKDPDELLNKYGKERYMEELKKSKEIFEFLYDFYSSQYSGDEIIFKKNLIERFKEFFQNITNRVEYSLYMEKLAKYSAIETTVLSEIFSPPKAEYREEVVKKESKPVKKVEKREWIDKLEYETVLIALNSELYYKKLSEKNIKNEFIKKIMNYAYNRFERDKLRDDFLDAILKDDIFFENEKREIVEMVQEAWTIAEPDEYFNEVNERWEKLEYEEMERQIEAELKMENITSERRVELMAKRFELLKKIKN